MATKKEKHARALAKRAEYEAREREIGLAAQRVAQKRRELEEQKVWDEAHEVHLKKNRFHEKCPHCAKIKARQALEKLTKATINNRASYIIDENGERSFEPVEEPENDIIDLSREEKASA